MSQYDFDIGILGAGSAGLSLASGAAQLGAKTLLIEKERLGGDCLHFGCVPSKTLIRTAQVHHLLKQAETFGLPKIEVPPVNFQQVARRIQSVIETIQEQHRRTDQQQPNLEAADRVAVDELRDVDYRAAGPRL